MTEYITPLEQQVEELYKVIDEKIASVGELVIEQERLRTALKKAKRYGRVTGADERTEVTLVFQLADFEPVQKFMEDPT